MSLVRVKGMWLNPEMVVGVWYERVEYTGADLYWRVTLRAAEGQIWQWKHPGEEDASRMCDEIASQVNTRPHPWSQYADEIVAGDRR